MKLEHHYPKFQEHDITAEEVPQLTEHHLMEIGITTVGDRVRIMQSVRSFLRGQRNEDRHKIILVFSSWTCKDSIYFLINTLTYGLK